MKTNNLKNSSVGFIKSPRAAKYCKQCKTNQVGTFDDYCVQCQLDKISEVLNDK